MRPDATNTARPLGAAGRFATVLAVAGVVSLTALPGMQAQALTSEVVVTSGLPAALEPVSVGGSCAGGPGTLRHRAGPGVPLSGTGSLELRASGTTGEVGLKSVDLNITADVLSGQFSLSVYAPVTDPGYLTAYVGTSDPGAASTDSYQLSTDVPSTTSGTWTPVNLGGAQNYTWYHFTSSGAAPAGSGTLAAFATAHSSQKVQRTELYMGDCTSATQVLNLDDIALGNGTTYNFEPQPPAVLTATAATAVAYGGTVTVAGTVRRSGLAAAAVPVELWRRAYPTTSFARVTTLTSSSTGAVASAQTPGVATTYQWRIAGTPYEVAAASAVRAVTVSAVVTAHVYDTTLSRTQQVLVYGLARPAKTGAVVRLFRAGSSIPLASTTLASDGTYAFARTLPLGTSYLSVVIPAATGNTQGKSATTKVVVS